MDDSRIESLLLQLSQDVAFIKAKLDNIDEIKKDQKEADIRIDHLEADVREHGKTIKALEHRSDEIEKFTRDSLSESNKTKTSIFISLGVCVFSAIVSFVFNIL